MGKIKISHSIPPIYETLRERFGVDWNDGIIITYGDTVYCKTEISPALKAHESVHVDQQTRMGKELWWEKYLSDPEFRKSQEVQAYRAQAAYYRNNSSREEAFHSIMKIAKDLSSSIYGNCCTFPEAHALISRK